MSDKRIATGIYFVKRMPQFEIFEKLNRISEMKLLQIILDNATVERKNNFFVDLSVRERLGRQCKVSERTIANALSNMSRPAENGGIEIFVRLGRGKYRLNPHYYFIGDQIAHNDAVENFNAFRTARKQAAKKKRRAAKKRKPANDASNVVELSIVGGAG